MAHALLLRRFSHTFLAINVLFRFTTVRRRRLSGARRGRQNWKSRQSWRGRGPALTSNAGVETPRLKRNLLQPHQCAFVDTHGTQLADTDCSRLAAAGAGSAASHQSTFCSTAPGVTPSLLFDPIFPLQMGFELETCSQSAAGAHKRALGPPSSAAGVAVAAALLAAWSATFALAVCRPLCFDAIGVCLFVALVMLYTGLFITAHDAMHCNVAPSLPAINNAIGQLCLWLYAGFDFKFMRAKHRAHHLHSGIRGRDPDFHAGNANALLWFLNFMRQYFNAWQALRLFAFVRVLLAVGVPYDNLVVYMAGAGLVSAVQLFYFGTYLPHKGDGKRSSVPEGRSSAASSRLGSWLRCYHFDCHRRVMFEFDSNKNHF